MDGRIMSVPVADYYESAVARSAIVGNVAMTLLDFGFTAAQLANAKMATLGVHVAGINFLTTGGAPTTLLGIPVADGAYVVLTNNNDIERLQLIATSATQSNVTVMLHWNVEGTGLD